MVQFISEDVLAEFYDLSELDDPEENLFDDDCGA